MNVHLGPGKYRLVPSVNVHDLLLWLTLCVERTIQENVQFCTRRGKDDLECRLYTLAISNPNNALFIVGRTTEIHSMKSDPGNTEIYTYCKG